MGMVRFDKNKRDEYTHVESGSKDTKSHFLMTCDLTPDIDSP